MRKTHKRRQVALLFVDILLMYAALLLALIIRRGEIPSIWSIQEHLRYFTVIFVGWILVFYTIGMYRLELPFDNLDFVKRLGIGALIAGLASAAYFYILPDTSIEPKTVLLIFIILYSAMFLGWRYSYSRTRRTGRQRIGVGFIGFGPDSRNMARELRLRPALGYDARFAFEEDPSVVDPEFPIIRAAPLIRLFVEDSDANLLVISGDRELDVELCRELYGLLDRRVRFIRLPDFYELILRRVPVGSINETWFLENIDLKAKVPYEAVKRVTDVILAFFVFLLTCWLWPLVALGIKLESTGPVFFSQKRLGRFDRPFTMVKFRTMKVEGNDQSPTGLGDARVTGLGRLLRATRIDELPQILNILRGEMSFVGPRPERPELATELEQAIPYYRQRHLVKPGITGWDQVSGEYHSPSIEDTNKKLQYDLYYLKNMSLYLDISIFFKTIVTVVQREGR